MVPNRIEGWSLKGASRHVRKMFSEMTIFQLGEKMGYKVGESKD